MSCSRGDIELRRCFEQFDTNTLSCEENCEEKARGSSSDYNDLAMSVERNKKVHFRTQAEQGRESMSVGSAEACKPAFYS